MNFLTLNCIIEILAVTFCLQIATLFGVVFLDRKRQEHLVFALFNVSLAGLIVCRLLMQARIINRLIALAAFQWQCVTACAAVATFVHFTCIVTAHPRLRTYLSPRVIYPLAVLIAALFFTPPVLHLAQAGTDPAHYDNTEIGPLFPLVAALVVGCGFMPCYLLSCKVRQLRKITDVSPVALVAANAEQEAEDAADLVLLRRHLAIICGGTIVLMVLNLIDFLWFLNPTSDLPISFGAVGMIFLSLTIAYVLAKDIVHSVKQKIIIEAIAQERLKSLDDAQHQVMDLTEIAQARLQSLRDVQHQLMNQIVGVSLPLRRAMELVEQEAGREVVQAKLASARAENQELQETLVIMLNVAREEAGASLDLGEKTSVDIVLLLEALCQKCADVHAPPSANRYYVESVLPLPEVLLQATALKQVFYNLLDNAFKYSSDAALVRVHIHADETLQRLVVRISDQGKGVALEDQERIFKIPFYRGAADTRQTPGTGLGLNLARRYMEAMGGSLWVESAGVELGSTFVVALPYEPCSSEPNAEARH